jgi:hypothetical protein
MEYSLRRDEYIQLYLKVFIPIPEICNKIILLKNDSEKTDALKYHIDRWVNIAGEHHYTRDNHSGKYSYIFDNRDYVIKIDHKLDFYKMTGISYQVIELIYELIRINHENAWDFDVVDKKEWLREDDKLYSELSKRIMTEMRRIL